MALTKAKQKKIPNYPVIDGHRKHYILYPIQKGKKWRGAEVVENGYLDPFKSPLKLDFKTEAECQKACDVHNDWLGFSKEQVNKIIVTSMNNSSLTEK